MKVAIIDSSDPRDFYTGKVDSIATHQLLGILGIESTIFYGLNRKYFKKALKKAARQESDIVHISCHGELDKKGLILGMGDFVGWKRLVALFQEYSYSPTALVMSACFGGVRDLASLFEEAKNKPAIIFGSRDDRSHADYATAWAILYRVLDREKLDKDKAKEAVEHINAVLDGDFVYRRWDDAGKRYRVFQVE